MGNMGTIRCDGGVVTQRTANPCTPVRIRIAPPHRKKTCENATMKTCLFFSAVIFVLFSCQAPLIASEEDNFFQKTIQKKWHKRDDVTRDEAEYIDAITTPTKDFSAIESSEENPVGKGTTSYPINKQIFLHASANIPFEDHTKFIQGKRFFQQKWEEKKDTHDSMIDGLGPLFNAPSCEACHANNGRGTSMISDKGFNTLLLRLEKLPTTPIEQQEIDNLTVIKHPDPIYGEQLNDRAISGLRAEGKVSVRYEYQPTLLKDDHMVMLRKPYFDIVDLAYGALHENTYISARITPQIIGLGYVDAIHPADIVKNADPDDLNDDGISGRVSLVKDKIGKIKIGKFGWKAEISDLRTQTSRAFLHDIGISTAFATYLGTRSAYGDCTAEQALCLSLPTGQDKEETDEAPYPVNELTHFYVASLAVPQRRNSEDEDVLQGKKLFYDAGCIACHIPKFVTRKDAEFATNSMQLIWPYSDFLLHDMGEDLADGQKHNRKAREWRTPPLWGIGLTKIITGDIFLLHDGRARSIEEAILWHGGEATKAKNIFTNMTKSARKKLILFIESL